MSERNFFTQQQAARRLNAYVALCRTCGCPWLVLPSQQHMPHRDTLSAKEAQQCGISVADALSEYTDELQRRRPLRRLCSALARVAGYLRAIARCVGGAERSRDYGVLGRWN
jgi:hypothetical protein